MKDYEVAAYLEEILLSYRFLFGQHKSSRKVFREQERVGLTCVEPTRVPNVGLDVPLDPLLDSLCSRKLFQDSRISLKERQTYRMHRDFPFLRNRFVNLKRELAMRKSRSWREMWRDKRDTSNWYTFWAVIFIGGLGLLFAAVQTAVGIAQLAYAVKAS